MGEVWKEGLALLLYTSDMRMAQQLLCSRSVRSGRELCVSVASAQSLHWEADS